MHLSEPSAQEVSDVCKNSVVICSYNSSGSIQKTISSGGFLLSSGTIVLSSEASSLFDGDAAAAFFVTGDFEIT